MHLKRILSAVVFLPLFYLLVRYGSANLFFYILSFAVLVGLYEFFALLESRGIRPLKFLGFVGGWALSLLMYSARFDRDDLLLFSALLVVSFLVSLLCSQDDFLVRIQGAGATLLGVLYLSLLLSFLALLRKLPEGATYIYYLFAVTWAGDAGAFYFGIHFGRHRLCPTLSPGKSVEGSIAGLLSSLGGSLLAKWCFFPRLGIIHALVLGILLGIAGQLGDLSESMLKRSFAVKDSGSLIPGHGGFLDRADSLLFTGPFLYFYVTHCLR
jgi:phosphatidate cytidylyltransferase